MKLKMLDLWYKWGGSSFTTIGVVIMLRAVGCYRSLLLYACNLVHIMLSSTWGYTSNAAVLPARREWVPTQPPQVFVSGGSSASMTYFKGNKGIVVYPTPLQAVITGYTITVYITKPDATLVTKSGSVTSGTTGQTSWTTAATDMDIVGKYYQQVKAVSGSSVILYGPIEEFRVEDTLG